MSSFQDSRKPSNMFGDFKSLEMSVRTRNGTLPRTLLGWSRDSIEKCHLILYVMHNDYLLTIRVIYTVGGLIIVMPSVSEKKANGYLDILSERRLSIPCRPCRARVLLRLMPDANEARRLPRHRMACTIRSFFVCVYSVTCTAATVVSTQGKA